MARSSSPEREAKAGARGSLWEEGHAPVPTMPPSPWLPTPRTKGLNGGPEDSIERAWHGLLGCRERVTAGIRHTSNRSIPDQLGLRLW